MSFKTIKGFLTNGNKEPDELLFKYCVSVRIGGERLEFNKIEESFQTKATRSHRKGETNGSIAFKEDMWLLDSTDTVHEDETLVKHLEFINSVFLKNIKLLKELNHEGSITIYCDLLTNSDTSGIEIPNECLKLYNMLEIPFNISFGYIGD